MASAKKLIAQAQIRVRFEVDNILYLCVISREAVDV